MPGIITMGDFERKTQLTASLKLLETEGKAQLLSNPKIVAKSGTQANITVGGEIPVPYSNAQGVGADFSDNLVGKVFLGKVPAVTRGHHPLRPELRDKIEGLTSRVEAAFDNAVGHEPAVLHRRHLHCP